jgi:hypothetical protein
MVMTFVHSVYFQHVGQVALTAMQWSVNLYGFLSCASTSTLLNRATSEITLEHFELFQT